VLPKLWKAITPEIIYNLFCYFLLRPLTLFAPPLFVCLFDFVRDAPEFAAE